MQASVKHTAGVVLLWGIAAGATYLVLKGGGGFAVLVPLYAICAIGTVVIVRKLIRDW